jgi:hypothetical protein
MPVSALSLLLQFKFIFTSLYITHAMDVTDSTAKFWLDVAQMDIHQDSASHPWQDEPAHSKTIEDPIHLFGRFVSVLSSDTSMDIRPRTEVS